MPYATVEQALAAQRLSSPFCKVLNGQWKFNWVPHPAQRPADFWKPDFDVSAWKEIPVPSNWQIQGYGTPYYRNNGYTFQKDWPRVLSEPPRNYTAYTERDPVGSYRHILICRRIGTAGGFSSPSTAWTRDFSFGSTEKKWVTA